MMRGEVLCRPMENMPVTFMSIDDLLASMDPENANEHDLDGDVKETAHSLLMAGWVEYGVVYNERLKKLVGGHGRIQSADWLRQQDPDWFERQWELWLAAPDRKPIAKQHHERFNPAYWGRAPVILVELDEHTHRSLLLRLNNRTVSGRDNPAKVAALLAKIPKQNDQLAGWSPDTKRSYVSAFLQKRPEPEPEPEVQSKQYFARPDATDYSEDPDDGPDDATKESGEVSSYRDPSAATWESEDEWGEGSFQGADGDVYEVANVETDSVGKVDAEGVNYDKAIRETRAVLLYSHDQLKRFHELAPSIPFILQARYGIEIDVARSIKEWRPDAMLALLEWFCCQQHADEFSAWKATRVEKVKGDEE